MSNVARPRGRKPAAVYWRRRIVVLAVLVGLAWLVVRLVGGGDEPVARSEPAAPAPQSSATGEEATPKPTPTPTTARKPAKPSAAPAKRVTTWLRAPRGRCDIGQVLVVPDVVDAEAGGPVALRMGLSTTAKQPCTLTLSGQDLAVEITSGDDLIWQSSGCRDVLEEGPFVLRPGWLTYVDLTWNGRRGIDDCADTNQPAQPGYYWAEAAVIGGEPARSQFRLEKPPPPPPPTPSPSEESDAEDEKKKRDDQEDESPEPSASPSSGEDGQT